MPDNSKYIGCDGPLCGSGTFYGIGSNTGSWPYKQKTSNLFVNGINKPHNNMPPYMVLAYVMKI